MLSSFCCMNSWSKIFSSNGLSFLTKTMKSSPQRWTSCLVFVVVVVLKQIFSTPYVSVNLKNKSALSHLNRKLDK